MIEEVLEFVGDLFDGHAEEWGCEGACWWEGKVLRCVIESSDEAEARLGFFSAEIP